MFPLSAITCNAVTASLIPVYHLLFNHLRSFILLFSLLFSSFLFSYSFPLLLFSSPLFSSLFFSSLFVFYSLSPPLCFSSLLFSMHHFTSNHSYAFLIRSSPEIYLHCWNLHSIPFQPVLRHYSLPSKCETDRDGED